MYVYTLSNGNIELTFDRNINNITSLINNLTKQDMITEKPDRPIFALVVLKEEDNGAAERITLFPDGDGRCINREKRRIEVKYGKMGNGIDISCILTIDVGEEIVVNLQIENSQELPVIEILCPMLDGIAMGRDRNREFLLYPHHAGEYTVNPIEIYASERYREFWRAQSVKKDRFYVREINYCGLASMSWMFYGNNEQGLYIGSHDDRFPVTGVIAGTAWPERSFMCFGFRKYKMIKKGERWNSKPYIIGPGSGDWHRGATRYRKWMERMFQPNVNPDFLKNEYALNQCYNFKKDGALHHVFSDIPSMFETGMDYGVRHMFLASWNRKGFDCNYPEYYPDMELGTSMDLVRGIEYVNNRGGFATFYINARLFDLESDFFEAVGRNMAIKNEKGELLTERYGPVEFSINCPSDIRWQKQLVDTAVFTARTYGARGIYLDQLASAEPFACYDKNHTHKDIGEFNNGYVKILSELKRLLKENNKDAFIMTENCGDIYAPYVWGNLTWNGAFYDEFFNMFKYTFPEYVQVNMVNPRSWIKDKAERDWWLARDMVRAVLLGSVLWIGFTSRYKDEPELRPLMRRVLNFRKSINPMIAEGKYRDDKGVTLCTPGGSASVWELACGGLLLIIGSPDSKPVELDINLPDGMVENGQYCENADGRIEIARKNMGRSIKTSGGMLFAVRFDVP